jgi:hypothetical protein
MRERESCDDNDNNPRMFKQGFHCIGRRGQKKERGENDERERERERERGKERERWRERSPSLFSAANHCPGLLYFLAFQRTLIRSILHFYSSRKKTRIASIHTIGNPRPDDQIFSPCTHAWSGIGCHMTYYLLILGLFFLVKLSALPYQPYRRLTSTTHSTITQTTVQQESFFFLHIFFLNLSTLFVFCLFWLTLRFFWDSFFILSASMALFLQGVSSKMIFMIWLWLDENSFLGFFCHACNNIS